MGVIKVHKCYCVYEDGQLVNPCPSHANRRDLMERLERFLTNDRRRSG